MDKSDVDFLVDLATRFYVLGQTQARIARELLCDIRELTRRVNVL